MAVDNTRDAVDQVLQPTISTVLDRFETAQTFSETAFNTAKDFLLSLADTLSGLNHQIDKVSMDDVNPPGDISFSTDGIEDLITRIRDSIEDVLSSLTDLSRGLGDPPSISAPPSFTYPEKPVFTPPSINFSEQPYSSDLLTYIKESLMRLMISGTGIPTYIETEIWNRNYERDIQAKNDAVDAALAEWSTRGFALPGSDIQTALTLIETEYMNKRTDTSRDIAIKKSDLEQQSIQFAIQQSTVLEGQLITYAAGMAQRAYDLQKALADLVIATFDACLKGAEFDFKRIDTILREYEVSSELAMKGYGLTMEGFKAKVGVLTAIADTDGKLASAMGDAYGTLARIQEAIANIVIKEYDAAIQKAGLEANIRISNSNIDAKNFEVIKSIIVEGQKAGAQIAAQMAAGALAGVAAHASLQADAGGRLSASSSWSESHNYQNS